MGRLLGFMLFPREGAAGGAWSFLAGFYIAAVVYTSWISPHIGSWVL